MRLKETIELDWQRTWSRFVPNVLTTIREYWVRHRDLPLLQKFLKGDIIDVGSGLATGLHFIGEGRRVAVDPLMEHYLALYEYPRDIECIAAPGEKLPFAADSFDSAMCTNCLDHVDDPEAVLSEIQRVLKPNGRLFLSVEIDGHKDDPAHPHRFDREAVFRLFKDKFNLEAGWTSPWIGVERFVRGHRSPVATELCVILSNGKETEVSETGEVSPQLGLTPDAKAERKTEARAFKWIS